MKKQIALLIILFFLINLFWEVSHTALYEHPQTSPSMTVYFYMLIMLYASSVDMIMLSIIFAIVSLKNRSLKWINNPAKLDIALIIILGTIIAIFIEVRALAAGRWSYNSLMPTIFGIGLTPLIQLFTTGITALWLVRK